VLLLLVVDFADVLEFALVLAAAGTGAKPVDAAAAADVVFVAAGLVVALAASSG
jgi:hypothetical protein